MIIITCYLCPLVTYTNLLSFFLYFFMAIINLRIQPSSAKDAWYYTIANYILLNIVGVSNTMQVCYEFYSDVPYSNNVFPRGNFEVTYSNYLFSRGNYLPFYIHRKERASCCVFYAWNKIVSTSQTGCI